MGLGPCLVLCVGDSVAACIHACMHFCMQGRLHAAPIACGVCVCVCVYILGSPLTYAYGPGYEEMLCLCGAPNCEGFIGGGSGSGSGSGSGDPSSDKSNPTCVVSLGLRAAAALSKKAGQSVN